MTGQSTYLAAPQSIEALWFAIALVAGIVGLFGLGVGLVMFASWVTDSLAKQALIIFGPVLIALVVAIYFVGVKP